MVELQEKHRAIHEAIDLPASFHGLRQHRRDQVSIDDLSILEEVKLGIHILGDVSGDNLIEKAFLVIPLVGIFTPQHRGTMHPFADHIRSVVEHHVGVRAIAPIFAIIKLFTNREISIEGDQLVKIGCRPFKFHF